MTAHSCAIANFLEELLLLADALGDPVEHLLRHLLDTLLTGIQ